MAYDLSTHRHNFSVWAAARAAQRAFTTVGNLRDALENCGVTGFLSAPDPFATDEAAFEVAHREWCNAIVGFLKQRGVPRVTFGRAAKLVAVYLKSMVVLGPGCGTQLARVAHPPVDRMILQNASRDPETPPSLRELLSRTNWTELDEREYYTLIGHLRALVRPGEPFWMLERFWTVTSE